MSQRDADTFISNNEREFILKALAENCRLDGRTPYDIRKPKIQFSLDDRSATVALGNTRVMGVVSAVLEAPFPDRPSEGPLRFNVEFSPMASPAFEPGRPGEDAIQVARLIERGLRQSGAVDQEALCVVAGRKVWSLRVDCHVLDHGGNLLDAAFLAALAALMAFRKPEVEVGGESGNEIVVHPPEVREPVPLTIHHLPVAVTFALFQDGDTLLVDPSWKEAAASSGSCTVVMNPAREVCCVHKADGIGLTPEQFMRCVRLAADKAAELVKALKAALEQHEVARVQARVRRHQPVAGLPDRNSRHVMVLGATDPAAAGNASAGQAPGAVAARQGEDVEEEDVDQDGDLDEEDESEEDGDGEGAGSPSGQRGEQEQQGAASGKAVGRKGSALGPGGVAGVKREKAEADGGGGAGRAGMDTDEAEEGPGQGARKAPQQRARLSGPLLAEGKGVKGVKRGAGAEGGAGGGGSGSGLKGSNSRGKDDVGFDELAAIAAVIAGVPPGGPASEEPEPSLAAAVKPGKQRKAK